MQKVIEVFEKIAGILEIIMASLVVLLVLFTIGKSIPEVIEIIKNEDSLKAMNKILEGVFSIVIAIEFLRMLLKPSSKTVIEVLIFLIARHLVVLETNALETLISVICILLLLGMEFLIEKFHPKKIEELK
ncbi:MAG: phosphate-starvation-inducible PsiE family protein [Treponemataceae bacterium]|nr:phosphate-starvation-inducible PsiE family protein [Treponemataceae bacterium]